MIGLIPNSICQGIGEKSLEDRLAPYIQSARSWFDLNVSPLAIDGAPQYLEQEIITVVHLYALWLAAPALDVTLHPNGLAVVSTDSLAPASAERSLQFRLSIMRHIMERLDALVPRLAAYGQWRQSAPARDIWLATVQPSAKAACQLAGLPYDFDSFLKAVGRIAPEEDAMAERAISVPLLEMLRSEKFTPSMPQCRDLRNCISQAISIAFSDESRTEKRSRIQNALDRFVNIVLSSRHLTDIFCQTPVGMLYAEPPKFVNTKDSTAYFF